MKVKDKTEINFFNKEDTIKKYFMNSNVRNMNSQIVTIGDQESEKV